MGFRERTYYRALAGLACRGMYLCHKLDLNISEAAKDLFEHFDSNYEKLTEQEIESLLQYWNKKTKDLKDIREVLSKFGVRSLNTV